MPGEAGEGGVKSSSLNLRAVLTRKASGNPRVLVFQSPSKVMRTTTITGNSPRRHVGVFLNPTRPSRAEEEGYRSKKRFRVRATRVSLVNGPAAVLTLLRPRSSRRAKNWRLANNQR